MLSFNPVGGYLFVALLAGGLLGLLALGPRGGHAADSRRRWLLWLRVAAILVFLLLLLRPTLVYRATRQRTATVVLLLDVSRSMQIADDGRKKRFEWLKETLADVRGELAELGEEIELVAYAFDSELHELNVEDGAITLPDEPEGKQTAMGWNLRNVLDQNRGKRVAAVILMGDGNQKALSPHDLEAHLAAQQYKDNGQVVHTVLFGQAGGDSRLRDASLEDLQVNETVHVKNRLTVKSQARLFGYVNQEIPVQLLWETSPGQMEVVETVRIRGPASGRTVPIEMHYTPQTPGTYKLTVKIVKPDELVTVNNEQSTFVRVTKGGLAVLYLEGSFRPETRGLLRSLGASRNMQLDYARLDAQKPRQRPGHVEQLLAEGLKPGKYDVFILGDLDSEAFLDDELQRLADAVKQGAGLIMLGGVHSFGPGGYFKAPLNSVLPVVMEPLDRQSFGAPLRTNQHLKGEVKLRISPRAERESGYSMILLDAANNAKAWAALPPLLNGANKLRRGDATVLLEDAGGNPILLYSNSGRGRVAAFAGDSTWRWRARGFSQQHRRFWRQVVLWLAKKDFSEEGSVWVKADPRRIRTGGQIELSAGAYSPEGEPLKEFELAAHATLPDGSPVTLRFSSQDEKRTLTFRQTTQPGDYTIQVTATAGGQVLGNGAARFLVYQEDLELERPVADLDTMRQIASITGGEAYAPREFPKLLEKLRQVPQSLEEEVLTVTTLWDGFRFRLLGLWRVSLPLAALLGLALVALLSVEWYLRKKWGLV